MASPKSENEMLLHNWPTIKVEPLFQNELQRRAFQIKFKGYWKYVGNIGILQNIPDSTKSLESLQDI